MVRTQIQLTEQQARALKDAASKRGISMAELIRQAVDQVLKEQEQTERWKRASALVGRYRGDRSDVSVNHDDYLADGYSE